VIARQMHSTHQEHDWWEQRAPDSGSQSNHEPPASDSCWGLASGSAGKEGSLVGAFAEFERSLIQERVKAELRNARAKGKRLGRPQRTDVTAGQIHQLREAGKSWRGISKQLAVPVTTIVEISRRP
jgi:DNA invertase Pin-like site-specific DNA recombinase